MPLFWCTCLHGDCYASVDYNGWFLPDSILLTRYATTIGVTQSNAMKSIYPYNVFPPKRVDSFSPDWVDALLIEGLDAFIFFFKQVYSI